MGYPKVKLRQKKVELLVADSERGDPNHCHIYSEVKLRPFFHYIHLFSPLPALRDYNADNIPRALIKIDKGQSQWANKTAKR